MIKKILKNILDFLNKKKYIFLAIILALAGGGYQIKASKAKKQASLKTAPVKLEDLTEKVTASGKIKADEEVILKFQTSGQLAWVGVKKGDKVKKWQAIAALDKQELEKNLKKELLDYMNQRWDFEQTNLDDYKDAALTETIRRVKEKSQFDLDRDVLDVEISDIALKYATLITPIEGIVTEIESPFAGVNITAATAEFVISNPNKLIFSANVDEADIGKLKVGQNALLILDAYPDEEISSTIELVEFTSTTTSGGGTAYAVKFSLPPSNENEKFKMGMNGDVEIIIAKREKILAVPFEVVREKENKKFVWILINDKPEMREIETGFSTDLYTEVKSGISEGDLVITSGFKNLENKNSFGS